MAGRAGQAGDSAPQRGDYQSVRLADLPVGTTLRRPLYEDRPETLNLLLAAGQRLLAHHIEKLKQRGVTKVLVHRSDWETIARHPQLRRPNQNTTAAPGSSANSISRLARGTPSWSGWKCDASSFLHRLQPAISLPRDPGRVAKFQQKYDQRVNRVTGVVQALLQHREWNSDATRQMCLEQLEEATEDFDEFLLRGAAPIFADYPFRHSLQTAMLATGIAVVMGHKEEDLSALGIGCLLHDVGMLMVPEHILAGRVKLTNSDRLELQKHPIYSANLLQECAEMPQSARHVVYQMHERMDGSGYPRGRNGSQIHPLARIAAVADTYLSLVSPRPFRAPLLPYQAVERILLSTRQGLFDAGVVRGLLHSVSLFPVGSYVRLNNGQLGQVVRSQRGDFDRPVVQLIDPCGPENPDNVVDLSEDTHLKIVAAAEPPSRSAAPEKTLSADLLAAAASL